MNGDLLIYMDNCCLNRPSDDQTQGKIRLESDTIKIILSECYSGSWVLVGSDVLQYEMMNNPDLIKRAKALNLYGIRKETIALNGEITARALDVQKFGLKPFDSLHFASAEYRGVDILLSVDKDFVKFSKRIDTNLRVENPVVWFMEGIEND